MDSFNRCNLSTSSFIVVDLGRLLLLFLHFISFLQRAQSKQKKNIYFNRFKSHPMKRYFIIPPITLKTFFGLAIVSCVCVLICLFHLLIDSRHFDCPLCEHILCAVSFSCHQIQNPTLIMISLIS